jgi:RNA polymerase sigma-70 factor (ECF subfamily)
VHAIIFNILKNKEDTEEAFQDTFLKIYRSLESYNYSASFGTWTYRIAYNTALDYFRKRKRKATEDLDQYNLMIEEGSQHLERLDILNKLEFYLAKLGTEEEQIIRLYYLREKSIQEVGEIVGLSTSNIKTKLFRSRKKLLDHMSEEDIVEFKNYYHE